MRIAIANDMPMAVEALRRFISSVPGYRVTWVAHDGVEAVEKCGREIPDLILMDLIMPVMDGVEATRRIMARTPCPILLVTSSVHGHSQKVFEALGAGALDVVQTPAATGPKQTGANLRFKIEEIARRRADRNVDNLASNGLSTTGTGCPKSACLIVLGASAGGPSALATILGALPEDFSASIVVVQHVDAQFVSLMAAWLDERSPLQVRVALNGDRIEPSTVLLAGTSDHLVFRSSQAVGYTSEPHGSSYQPSIDVLFESALSSWRGALAGVLLTGMGRDGARGLKAMRDAGFYTIAQDAATSAVYGMPKAAAEMNAASQILPVQDIAKALVNFVSSSGSLARG